MKTLRKPDPTPITTDTGTAWHVYNRGRRGKQLFYDESDYIVFLALLKQHLRLQRLMDDLDHPPYKRISMVKLYAYNLTEHGYQLLLRESGEAGSLQRLAHALMYSYEGYFHAKYKSKGSLLADVYKSTKVENAPLLVELTVAMHQVVDHGWRRSSRPYYEGRGQLDWLASAEIIALAGGLKAYRQLLTQSTPLLMRRKR